MPDHVNKPRSRRGKLLLQSAAITTSTLLVWCNRASDENTLPGNPKGSTYDIVAADAAPEPTATVAQDDPATNASVAQPTPSAQSTDGANAGPQDAGAPDAKPPTAKPTVAPTAPPKKIIYANPKGSLYEDPSDEPLHEPHGIDRQQMLKGPGSARG